MQYFVLAVWLPTQYKYVSLLFDCPHNTCISPCCLIAPNNTTEYCSCYLIASKNTSKCPPCCLTVMSHLVFKTLSSEFHLLCLMQLRQASQSLLVRATQHIWVLISEIFHTVFASTIQVNLFLTVWFCHEFLFCQTTFSLYSVGKIPKTSAKWIKISLVLILKARMSLVDIFSSYIPV